MNKNTLKTRKETSKESRGMLRIFTGLVFLIFAIWLGFTVSKYPSMHYDLVSENITLNYNGKTLQCDSDTSKKISKKLQNSLRFKDIETKEFPLEINLNNGIIILINPDEKEGKLQDTMDNNEELDLVVGSSLIKLINNYFEEQ